MSRRFRPSRGAAVFLAGLLPACGHATGGVLAPGGAGDLSIDVAGRLERAAIITLHAELAGQMLAPDALTWETTPAGLARFVNDSQLELLQSGWVQVTVRAGERTGRRTLPIQSPPTILFDLTAPDGNRDIWRMELDGRNARRLTTDPAADEAPTSAPGAIVFVSYRGGAGALYRMSAEGMSQAPIVSVPAMARDPSLSPDGRTVAYISTASGVPKLWRTGRTGTAPVPVTRAFGFAGSIEARPSWNADGSRIAFASTAGGTSDLMEIGIEGEDPTILLATTAAEVDPAWSPDGAWLVYVSSAPGDAELYRYALATGDTLRLTHHAGTDGRPTWLADGRIVYLSWEAGTPSLRWLDPMVPGVSHPIPAPAGLPDHPAALR